MSYKYRGEYCSGPERCATPQEVEVTISDELYAQIPKIAEFVKAMKLGYALKWYAADFTFFMEDEDGSLIEEEPDFITDGCHLQIYADGEIMFEFPVKHSDSDSDEKGYMGPVNFFVGVHIE